MKKLLVLSALLGLLVLPVFAEHQTIDFGGDDTYGFITDFGTVVAEKLDLTWDVIVGIDDYNSFTWSTAGLTTGFTALDKALVTTDMGMWAGLPVGWKVMWGYDDPDANEFQSISGYGNEEIFNFSPAEYWGIATLLSFGFVEVELAADPNAENGGSLLAGLAVKEPIAGMNAEFYYFQNQSSSDVFDQGQIGIDAGYSTEFSGFGLEAGAGLLLDLADGADAWAYGVGLSGAYSIATVTVGLDGNETDALNSVSATAEFALIEMLAAYAGLWYDMAGSELAEVDLGVNAHVGAVQVYVGYLIDGDSAVASGGNFNSPTGINDSGAYVKFDVNY
jgi:hypothetical protein